MKSQNLSLSSHSIYRRGPLLKAIIHYHYIELLYRVIHMEVWYLEIFHFIGKRILLELKFFLYKLGHLLVGRQLLEDGTLMVKIRYVFC